MDNETAYLFTFTFPIMSDAQKHSRELITAVKNTIIAGAPEHYMQHADIPTDLRGNILKVGPIEVTFKEYDLTVEAIESFLKIAKFTVRFTSEEV